MVKKQHPRPKKNPSKAPPPSQEPADQDQDKDKDKEQHQKQLELEAQQRLLDIFAHAFLDVLAAHDFPQRLRDVKQALFDRDFAAAFGSPDRLHVYAARYSPTRALCYASILHSIGAHLDALGPGSGPEPSGPPGPRPNDDDDAASASAPRLRMLAIGGCAAEHVAFAAYLRSPSSAGAGASGALTLVDSAPWGPIASLLQERITSPPPLSRYASAAARAAAAPLLDGAQLSTVFAQHDVLALGADRLGELAAGVGGAPRRPVLVTLMFTLNELYTTQGIGRTTAFLGMLGDVVPAGSLLLVVDSPGSYSEAAVGRDKKKKYPMQWLLDHTLLHTQRGSREAPRWRGLESQDSVWFRLPDALTYPIQLENMRYQMHLYRREETAGEAQV